jgi:hypothetical protein
VSRSELERQTSTLREPDERDALSGNALLIESGDERAQHAER